MKFKTRSGSIYEVDEANKRARKVGGDTPGTTRLNEEWRAYDDIFCFVGAHAFFFWTPETPLLKEHEDDYIGVPMTETSPVVEIYDLH